MVGAGRTRLTTWRVRRQACWTAPLRLQPSSSTRYPPLSEQSAWPCVPVTSQSARPGRQRTQIGRIRARIQCMKGGRSNHPKVPSPCRAGSSAATSHRAYRSCRRRRARCHSGTSRRGEGRAPQQRLGSGLGRRGRAPTARNRQRVLGGCSPLTQPTSALAPAGRVRGQRNHVRTSSQTRTR